MRSNLRLLSISIGIAFLISGVAGIPGITADFTASPVSGYAPLTVQFNDSSSGSPSGWAWFFGDERYAQPWTLVNAVPGWSARFGQSSVVTMDGSLVLMGGADDSANLNDTWKSTDNGATWEEVNTSSGWAGRVGHSSVAMPGGNIVLMGGVGDTIMNDTWMSTDNGATWALMNASSGWAGRYYHASVAMPDGSIVLNGGRNDSGRLVNDTWRSTDNGATWVLLNPSSGWSGRNGHEEVAMPDGSIVLMGGYDGTNTYNDTWKSTDNGLTWARVNANSGWPTRQGLSAVVMPDGSIVLMGGYAAPPFYNDFWRSINNGKTWTRLSPSPGWAARLHHSSVVMPDGSIVLLGGMDDTFSLCSDVWRLQPAGSSLRNPLHTYSVPGTYRVALQAFNTGGYSSVRKPGYILSLTEPNGGDSDPVSVAAIAAAQNISGTVDVNIGGNSAIARSTVTGKGISGLIVTGFVVSGPGTGTLPAPGTVFQYVDLTPARYTTIDQAVISFVIPQSWIEEHHLALQDIILYHNTGTGWKPLPTTMVSSGNGQVLYTAVSPGFSRFAIAGSPGNIIAGTPEITPPVTVQMVAPLSTTAVVTAVNEPVTPRPTAVPALEPASGFPFTMLAIVCAVVLVLGGCGFVIRRWWIRRQNPALFERYD